MLCLLRELRDLGAGVCSAWEDMRPNELRIQSLLTAHTDGRARQTIGIALHFPILYAIIKRTSRPGNRNLAGRPGFLPITVRRTERPIYAQKNRAPDSKADSARLCRPAAGEIRFSRK